MIKGLADLLKKYKDGNATDEQFEEELNKALPNDWVPKSTFNEQGEKLKLAEKQSKEMSDQLKALNDKANLSDEYKKQIADLEEAQKKAQADFEKQMTDMKHATALDKALSLAKVKNAKAVKALLDDSKLVYGDDDKIVGLDEQIKALKESDSYLFEDANSSNPSGPSFGIPAGGGNPPAGGNSLFDTMMSAAGIATKK